MLTMKAIEPRTFDGLTLQHLFVNGNRNVRIDDESFVGLATTGLYLHDCSLRYISPESIVRLNFTLRYICSIKCSIRVFAIFCRPY